jgi:endonuclease YncB( thermonuclease family)
VNGEWLEVAVTIDADRVQVEALGTPIGSWPRPDVHITESSDELFSLNLNGEVLPFKPHARLPFAAAIVHSAPVSGSSGKPRTPGWWAHQTAGGKAAIATGVMLLAVGIANTGDSPERELAAPNNPTTTAAASIEAVIPSPLTTGAPSTTTTTVPASVMALVVWVTDGDTIRVTLPDGTEEPVRLIGIDAPERGRPLSEEAAAFLEGLVLGNEVELVTDVSDRDGFDRLLRYVFVGDTNVNEAMVLAGFAIAKEYPPDTAMADLLAGAEAEAKNLQLGGWATTTTSTSTTTTTIQTLVQPPPDCHPSYQGACVPIGVSDVDCAGGSGNGPYYVRGPVDVVGPDVYDLDRDGDGIGCEN